MDLTVAAGGVDAVEDHFAPEGNGQGGDGLYQDPAIDESSPGDSVEDPVAVFFSRPPPNYEGQPGS